MSYKKYYLYKEQISYDSGTTWQDTGNQTPSGDPIGEYETYEQCTGGTPPTPTACTCDAFAFDGTSEGNNTYRIEIPSGETAVTAASWNTSCGLVPQGFTHTDDAGFQAIVTGGSWAFDNNIIRFTASTNPTSSVRQGNMTITYTVDGVSCTKVTHLVQAAGQGFNGKYKLILNDSSVVTAACDSSSAVTSGISNQYRTTVVNTEIGNCVSSIDQDTFYLCYSLTSVTIPDSVTSIGNRAFGECSGLTSVNIPTGLTNIGNSAFVQCSGLTGNFEISDSVTNIGEFAFYLCTHITDINIPSGITRINQSVFSACFSLTSITIPNSVTSIGNDAFGYCSSLTSITINRGTPPTLGNNVFYDTNNCPIYVPAESVNAYKTASRWSTYASRIQAIP